MKLLSKMIRILFAGFLFSALIFPIISFPSGETASSTNYPLFQQQPPATDAASAQIYQEKCATCHDQPVGRVPSRSAIALGSTEEIIQTMTTGSMKQFADGLTADQIRALTIYLTAEQAGGPVRGKLHANPCKSTAGPITLGGPNWNGWGRDLDNSRYQPKPGIVWAQAMASPGPVRATRSGGSKPRAGPACRHMANLPRWRTERGKCSPPRLSGGCDSEPPAPRSSGSSPTVGDGFTNP